jgi:hypothetical protein
MLNLGERSRIIARSADQRRSPLASTAIKRFSVLLPGGISTEDKLLLAILGAKSGRGVLVQGHKISATGRKKNSRCSKEEIGKIRTTNKKK